MPTNDEGVHPGQSWFQHIWRVEQFALHLSELFAILRDPRPQRFKFFSAILNPTAFAIVQIEASNVIHKTKCWCQFSHQTPKRERSNSEVVSVSTLGRLQEIQVVWVPWDNNLLEPSEDRVKGHRLKETTRWTTLSYTSGHKELSSICSREFHVCDSVPVNTSQEATEKGGQSSVLDHREDPGVIDTGIGGSKVSQ